MLLYNDNSGLKQEEVFTEEQIPKSSSNVMAAVSSYTRIRLEFGPTTTVCLWGPFGFKIMAP